MSRSWDGLSHDFQPGGLVSTDNTTYPMRSSLSVSRTFTKFTMSYAKTDSGRAISYMNIIGGFIEIKTFNIKQVQKTCMAIQRYNKLTSIKKRSHPKLVFNDRLYPSIGRHNGANSPLQMIEVKLHDSFQYSTRTTSAAYLGRNSIRIYKIMQIIRQNTQRKQDETCKIVTDMLSYRHDRTFLFTHLSTTLSSLND